MITLSDKPETPEDLEHFMRAGRYDTFDALMVAPAILSNYVSRKKIVSERAAARHKEKLAMLDRAETFRKCFPVNSKKSEIENFKTIENKGL